jgi:hypothetical protein
MPLGPEDITLTGKTLTGGVITGSTLVSPIVSSGTILGTTQTSGTISGTTLTGCLTTASVISGSTLMNCQTSLGTIIGTTQTSGTISGTTQTSGTITGTTFTGNITGSTFAGNVAAASTLTSPHILGTSTLPHVLLSSNALLATAPAGGIEYDGVALYMTAASSSRQIVPTEQFIFNSSAYTGSTAGAAQKMFDASTGLNGALVVGPSISYMFETAFAISGRSTLTHTVSYGLGGTAAVDRITFTSIIANAAASSVPSATFMARCVATVANICVTNTSSTLTAFIQGRLTIGTSGTIIPQITRSASVVALVIQPDAYFRIWPIGSTAVTRVGHWS